MSAQHPGKILLQQYLVPQNLSQNKLARAIKVPPRRINEIIHQKRGITADTAVRLAIYFSNSASDWMRLQAEYEIAKVTDNINTQLSSLQATPPIPILQTAETKPMNASSSAKKRIMR